MKFFTIFFIIIIISNAHTQHLNKSIYKSSSSNTAFQNISSSEDITESDVQYLYDHGYLTEEQHNMAMENFENPQSSAQIGFLWFIITIFCTFFIDCHILPDDSSGGEEND